MFDTHRMPRNHTFILNNTFVMNNIHIECLLSRNHMFDMGDT